MGNADRKRWLFWQAVGGRRRWLLLLFAITFSFCAAPAFAQVALPDGRAGVAYSFVFAQPTVGSIGALPNGVTFDLVNREISGIPTEYGDFTFAVDFPGPVTISHSLRILPPDLSLDPTALPPAMEGRFYDVTRGFLGVSPPQTPFICACITAVVPPQGIPPHFFPFLGLVHNGQTGQISGIPAIPATLTIDAQLADFGYIDVNPGGFFYESPVVRYTLVITPALALAPSPLPDATESAVYNQPITAPTGGAGPYTFAAIGTLPAGITVSPTTGAFTGTPAAGTTGFYNVQVRATDANGYDVTAGPYNLTVNIAAAALPPTALPTATRGSAYSQQIAAATGGREPFTYAHIGGTLPAGVAFDPLTRTVSGTPTETGTFTFEIAARDALLTLVTRTYQLIVVPPGLLLPPAALPNAVVGTGYSQVLAATGGTGRHTFALTGGALPVGIQLTTNGELVGTPIAEGTANFTITVTDAANVTATQTYQIVVTASPLALPATALPDGMVLLAYNRTIASAVGGTGPYRYAVTGGTLPTGIRMDGLGLLDGVPTATGPYTFTVTATDQAGRTAQRSYTLTVVMLPDPRTGDLLDLLAWQHHAAAAFASDQNDNIGQRLEQLRGGGSPGIVVVDETGNPYFPKIQQAAGSAIENALGTALPKNFGLWTAGTLTVGTIDHSPTIDFASSSLTIGWDTRVTDVLTLGLAAGFGGNRGVIGTLGTTGDAAAKYVAAYASLQPTETTFIESTLGAGIITYDTRRFDPVTSAFATGRRNGQQLFGSVSGGVVHPVGDANLSAYGRVEGSFARLGAYTETGGVGALAFTAQDIWAMSGTLGIEADYSFHLEWGAVTPGVRVEYRHGSFGASDATVQYAGLLNLPGFGLSGSLAAENAGTIGIQTAFDFAGGLAVTFGYDARIGTTGTVAHTVRGIVSGAF